MGIYNYFRRNMLRLKRKTIGYSDSTIHYLHVSKAAGTQINHVIKQVNQYRRTNKLIKRRHEVHLCDLPAGHDYFFSTRDPISRFKSGFYSRLRKGQPRLYAEWSDQERLAFERFPDANDLAEALFAPGRLGRDATSAIRSIEHSSRNLVDWFIFNGFLFESRPPLWIIRQEHFSSDVSVFLRLIGHNSPVDITKDRGRSHAMNYDGIPDLSETAKSNLRRWYVQDYAFLEACENWMEESKTSLF